MNVLNAANEIAVAAYLAEDIGFLEIAALVEETVEKAVAEGLTLPPATIKDALALDKEARRIATSLLPRHRVPEPSKWKER